MTLQVLPPEMLEGPKDKIETKEAQPYWKPSSLKDGESEEFRLLGCYETGHAIMGWQYASEKRRDNGELGFAGYVVTRTHPGQPDDIARETDWSKPDRPKIDGTFVKPRRFLAWVATSAARGRLEVLFIEQKSLREHAHRDSSRELKTTLGPKKDLLIFRLRLAAREPVWKLHTASLPKVRKVPDKIKSTWEKEKDTIWLPNFFEGKDPFDGKQVDAKGLPAGGTDKRGAHVTPTTAKKKVEQEEQEF